MTNNTDKQNMLNKLIFNDYVLSNPTILKELIDAGANPAIYSNKKDATPLLHLLRELYYGDVKKNEGSTRYDANVEAVLESTKLLIDAGAKIGELNNQQHYTAQSSILDRSITVNPLIEYLVEQGVDFVNYRTSESVLLDASSPAVLKFLVELGADPNGKQKDSREMIDSNNQQNTPPIALVAKNCRDEKDSIEMIQILLDAGADINLVNEQKEYVLANYMFGEPKLLHFLLDNGADPSLEDYYGDSALSRLLERLQQTEIDDKNYAELVRVKDRMLEIMGLDLKL